MVTALTQHQSTPQACSSVHPPALSAPLLLSGNFPWGLGQTTANVQFPLVPCLHLVGTASAPCRHECFNLKD